MMPWYVFALTDAAPAGRTTRGMQAPVSFRPIGGVFAAVERRADVPPAELGSLRRHQQVVDRLAARVPAILPVRFGTLLDADDLREAIEARQEDFRDALALVRGCVQFTWRAPWSSSSAKAMALTELRTLSGTEYLRIAATSTRGGALRRMPDALRPLAVRERHQSATAALPATTYHLVRRGDIDAYIRAAKGQVSANTKLKLSGPWPPYAFAPALV